MLGMANEGHGTLTGRGALSWPVIRDTPTTVGDVLCVFSDLAHDGIEEYAPLLLTIES